MTSKTFADDHPSTMSRRSFMGLVMASIGTVALLGRRKTPTPQPTAQAIYYFDAPECLSMVAQHWGKRIDPASLDLGVTSWASHLTSNVIKAARDNGFRTYTGLYLHADADPLTDAPGPWLTCWGLWNDARWLVVQGIQDNHVVTDSPSAGRRLILWAEFKEQWHKPITLLLLP